MNLKNNSSVYHSSSLFPPSFPLPPLLFLSLLFFDYSPSVWPDFCFTINYRKKKCLKTRTSRQLLLLLFLPFFSSFSLFSPSDNMEKLTKFINSKNKEEKRRVKRRLIFSPGKLDFELKGLKWFWIHDIDTETSVKIFLVQNTFLNTLDWSPRDREGVLSEERGSVLTSTPIPKQRVHTLYFNIDK